MKVLDFKPLDYIIGMNDKYIVIDNSGTYTLEVFNVNTMEEETIEGDYLENGNVDHLEIENKGNIEIYLLKEKMTDVYRSKLENIVKEIREYYYN